MSRRCSYSANAIHTPAGRFTGPVPRCCARCESSMPSSVQARADRAGLTLPPNVDVADSRADQRVLTRYSFGNVALEPQHLCRRNDDGRRSRATTSTGTCTESQMAGRRGGCQLLAALVDLGKNRRRETLALLVIDVLHDLLTGGRHASCVSASEALPCPASSSLSASCASGASWGEKKSCGSS